MTRILIIDDDAELFALVERYLREEGFLCAHADTPERGLRESASGGFGAVVLDVMLPGMNGFEVLRRLRSEGATARLPVLMLSARGEEIDRVVGLEAGADDYLPKPFSPRELAARLRALVRRSSLGGQEPARAAVLRVGDLSINRKALCAVIGAKTQELTVPEMRLLSHLAEKAGEVVGREFLYKSLFGHQAYPMDRSLDMLVSRLRRKLGPRKDGGERIKAVRGEGYVYLMAGEEK
ncbi:MAG: response regulator transcription factor [Deltaproteobacteria bacterium]|jgi:two-component system response regulator CpxR|nr:response regulator transcription factor [Deltaproteobacteria bacterium]